MPLPLAALPCPLTPAPPRPQPFTFGAPSQPLRRRVLAAGHAAPHFLLPSALRAGRSVRIRPPWLRLSSASTCPGPFGSGARKRLASPRFVPLAGLPGSATPPLGTRAQLLEEAPHGAAAGCLCAARRQAELQAPLGAAGEGEESARKGCSDPQSPRKGLRLVFCPLVRAIYCRRAFAVEKSKRKLERDLLQELW